MAVKAFVSRGIVTVATEVRSPPSILLRSAQYDNCQGSFVPADDDDGEVLESMTLPLEEGEHLAAIAVVGCRVTGLMRTFLVLATRERFTVGRLDLQDSTFEPSGTIWLPRGVEYEEEECWLADGPTLVVAVQGRVVVASMRQEQSLSYHEFGRYSSPLWKADMVEGSFERVFLAGDYVLCVLSDSAGASSSVLPRLGELKRFSLPSNNQVGCHSPPLVKIHLPLELDPHLLTCMAYVPGELCLPYGVVCGTSERRLLFCARDSVFKEISLEDAPFSLQFALVAHGAVVLVISLCGMDRKVVAISGESFCEIHVWTSVQQVVVGDIARLGHDQMALLIEPLSSPNSFVESLCISHLEPTPHTASDKHKSKIVKSMTEALNMRLQEGVKELQAADQRRQEKMDMVTGACNLMQRITVQQDGIENSNLHILEDALYVGAIQVHEVCQERYFMIIDVCVHKHVPEGFHLSRPTLFLTSLHGHIDNFSACLPSQLNSQRFLISYPLKGYRYPVHILLSAEMSIDKTSSNVWDSVGLGFGAQECGMSRAPKIYTQCLHTMEKPVISTSDYMVAPSPNNMITLCKKWMSGIGGSVWKQHLDALVTAVCLQTNSGDQMWRVQDGIIDIQSLNMRVNRKMPPLSGMYAHDLSLVPTSNVSMIDVDTLSSLFGPKLAELVRRFTEVWLEELRSSRNETPGSINLAEVQAVTDRCFCHLLSSIMHNTFGQF